MERTGTLPRGGVDVAHLAPLLSRPGPVATVVTATPAATENAGPKASRWWSAARRRLQDAGAPDAALDAVGDILPDAHRSGEGMAVYADDTGLLAVEHSPVPPSQELLRWDRLPTVTPIVDWRQHQPTYVVALVDRRGADIFTSGAGLADRTDEVRGDGTYPIHQTSTGAWSERHHQQHVIDNWDRNAAEVTEALDRLVADVDPEVIVVAGDPSATGLLRGHLPSTWRDRVVHVPGARAADGGGDHLASEVGRLVATAAAEDTVAMLEEFRQRLGRGDRAVEGVAATLTALRQGRVAVLLIHDDPGDGRRAWFGREAGLVGAAAADLDGVGSGERAEGRLVDVAVKAAVETSATLHLVPAGGGPHEGIGALLRWDTDQPHST